MSDIIATNIVTAKFALYSLVGAYQCRDGLRKSLTCQTLKCRFKDLLFCLYVKRR
ncbi:hypothetical protein EV356DRAFT_499710 [Viridothelium virens]|uniref:Uncharacterized protein n=1 Tax=Viridothelium virens TaxID=1048519 RepID=A0A6A6HN33_VIRVR|nr:hypothetical protein EV356DRAFT_499710 [Viridothelium virens]